MENNSENKDNVMLTNAIIKMVLAFSIIVLIITGLFYAVNQQVQSSEARENAQTAKINHNYHQLKNKPYVTIKEAKKAYKEELSNDENKKADSWDGSIVVDPKNGHEYMLNISGNRLNTQFQLVPQMKGKSIVINKAWQKERQNR